MNSGYRPADTIPIKRAIETALAIRGGQDLARVTRAAYSELHGVYFATIQFPETKYHIRLRGVREVNAKTESVMQDYDRDYPGRLADALVP